MAIKMNIYQIVTQRILEQLEQGVIPWRKPWFSITNGAHSALSGHQYSCLNQLILPKSGAWCTYNGWKKLGGQVRQNERSSIVTFYRWSDDSKEHADDETPDDTEPKLRRPVLKYYHVFHVSQVDGVEPLILEEIDENHVEPITKAEDVLMKYIAREQIQLDTGYSDKACFVPCTDTIHLPMMEQFRTAEAFYATAFHEAIHSTGVEKRLHRKGLKDSKFGSNPYAKEELIAELGSACIMNSLGIETDDSFQSSASYIQNWLSVLKRDARFVISASGQAEKAVKYITGSEVPQYDLDHQLNHTGNNPEQSEFKIGFPETCQIRIVK